VVTEESLAAKFEALLPHLDERQRRLLLTGLTPTQWDELIEKLSVARHAQPEAHLHTRHTRRGGPRHAAAGTGRKAVLTLDDRAAITVLYQRFSLPQPTLAHLFGVTPQTISNVIRQTRTLLRVIGHTPSPQEPVWPPQPSLSASQPPPVSPYPTRSNLRVINLRTLTGRHCV
jgi:hypothetical protein